MKEKESKKVIRGIWIFSIVVWALVILLHELPKSASMPDWMSSLPLVHAVINGSCALLLISSLVAVKKKNFVLHQRLNTLAMILSVIFLLSYVTYHYFAGDTAYGGNNKAMYYIILISHIVLAGLSLPFILLSYYRGLVGSLARHKKMVRFTYPVWLYVCLTGVVVYLFLAPYYAN